MLREFLLNNNAWTGHFDSKPALNSTKRERGKTGSVPPQPLGLNCENTPRLNPPDSKKSGGENNAAINATRQQRL